jgi:type IV secretion system protein VirB8
MNREGELSDYLRESASWDADRLALAQRSARRAWALTALFGLLASGACAAIAFLTPLKTVEPFVIRVDNTSGVIDVVPVYQGGAPLTDTVTRYLLMHYVTTCERYLAPTAEQDYTECGAFHSARRNQEWASHWARANPESPLNRFRDGSSLQADVKAISFFKRSDGLSDLAQVRYTTLQRDASGGEVGMKHWIVTIQYTYAKPSQDPNLRRWNPLGFKVLDFHAEPELPEAPSTGTVAAVGAQP